MFKTKGQNVVAFVLAIVIIAAVCYSAAFGLGDLFSGCFDDDAVTLGLDIAGGARIVYTPHEYDPSDEEIDAAIARLQARLDALGYSEATVHSESSSVIDCQLVVEIPGAVPDQKTVDEMGATAVLTFENETYQKDKGIDYILTGADIKNAEAQYGDANNQGYSTWYVSLEFNDSAVDKFAEATGVISGYSTGNTISIALDGDEITAPQVSEKLSTSSVVITGNFDESTARYYASVIKAGSLPFGLDVGDFTGVQATLGADALQKCLVAGAIGILLVMIFMVIIYRLSGLMADLALCAYVGLTGLCILLFNVNLSLAGIAGIVLAIGMAVDANVVIFERIKEELRAGKSTASSVKAGFKNAMSAVADSNITTVIAAVVLYFFGTGSVRGFALTLGIGVVLSFISAVFISKFFMNRLVGMGATKPVLYGVNKAKAKAEGEGVKEKKVIDFISKRLIFAIIAVVVIIVGVVSFAIRGFNLGQDFTGGTQMSFVLHDKADESKTVEVTDDVISAIKDMYKAIGVEDAEVVKNSETGSVSVNNSSVLTAEQQDSIKKAVAEKYTIKDDESEYSTTSGSVSKDLKDKAIKGVAIAVALMLIYIIIRFNWRSGIAAVVCLCHDVLIMLVAYTVLGLPMDSNMIAAILTIVGYSINATIIVFDRVRENTKLNRKLSFRENANLAVNQTFNRSLNTTLTTLFTIGMIFVLGPTSIKNFSLPIIVGVIAGLFSSVCLATNIWVLLKGKKSEEN